MWGYIIAAIVIVLFLFSLKGSHIPNQNYTLIRLEELKIKLRHILNYMEINPFPMYHLYLSPDRTKKSYTVNKNLIYLYIGDYDNNTLMHVLCHEMAHVLSQNESDDHGPDFRKWNQLLLTTAEKLNYYNPKIEIDAKYPAAL